VFDLKRRVLTLANSGLPYPVRCTAEGCTQIELPGVPLGSFQGTTYDEVTFALHAGDLFVLCTDGVFEAMNALGQEFTSERLLEVVGGLRDQSTAKVVNGIFEPVSRWRGDTPPNDDMTAVAVRITT
jgi:sigma-B regulation protein RsbU (phosphoserine phosphatase)